MQLILSVADDTITRLRHLIPRTGRSTIGSETMIRVSSDASCRRGRSGYISRTERMSWSSTASAIYPRSNT